MNGQVENKLSMPKNNVGVEPLGVEPLGGTCRNKPIDKKDR